MKRFLFPMIVLISASLSASSATEDYSQDDIMFLTLQIEEAYQIPAYLLYAIALRESGRSLNGQFYPWPLALNIHGKGMYPETMDEAKRLIDEAIAGRKVIDIGLCQQNLKYQQHRYLHPYDMLDPMFNLRGAALTLREWYGQTGSWVQSIASYHAGHLNSKNINRAQSYVSDVWRLHVSLIRTGSAERFHQRQR